MNVPLHAGLRQVISADQIQKRVRELGRQISDDYRGQTVIALGILENSFLFMADLVRAHRCARHLRLYQAELQAEPAGESPVLEILFSHELAIAGKHVLLVEGLVHSGSDQRIPDERPARTGRGFGQTGDAARSPVGAPRAAAAGLFRISGG
jgi:hypoxanthine-guanine phosphoribosyltransferase